MRAKKVHRLKKELTKKLGRTPEKFEFRRYKKSNQ